MNQDGLFLDHIASILQLQVCQQLFCRTTVQKQAPNWSAIKAQVTYKVSLASCRRMNALLMHNIVIKFDKDFVCPFFRNYSAGTSTWYLNWISNSGSISGPNSALTASSMMGTLNINGTPNGTTCLAYQFPQDAADFINCTIAMNPICMKVQSGILVQDIDSNFYNVQYCV